MKVRTLLRGPSGRAPTPAHRGLRNPHIASGRQLLARIPMAVTFQRLPKASTTDRSELAEKLCNRVIACFPKQIDVFPTDARHVGLKFASLPGDFKTVQTSEQFFRKWLAINTRIFGFVPFCTVFPGAKLRTLKHRDLTLSTFSENAEKRYGALDRSFVNCCSSRFIFLETSIFVRF